MLICSKKKKKTKEERLFNYKPIFLRSKAALLSVVVYNLK